MPRQTLVLSGAVLMALAHSAGAQPAPSAVIAEAAATPKPAPRRDGPVLSPEVAEDGRVTFRLRAEKAKEVKVTGEWPGGRNPTALVRDAEGVWSATLGPLPADLYGYGFLVDGLRIPDPANARIKPSRTPDTSILDMPASPPKPHDRQGAPAGTVRLHSYQSKALGRTRFLRVYTPAEYDRYPTRRYPTLYLFHGFGDHQDTWTELGRAQVIADNLITSKQAVPLIIVMTDGHAVPANRETMVENVERFRADLVGDVMPLIDATYRTRPAAKDRAIAGLSMGGLQSVSIGLGRPDLFAWVVGFSSGLRAPELFDASLADAKMLAKKLRLVWLAIGKDDFLLAQNRDFHARLEREGLPHTYLETEGDHSWPVWRRYLADVLPLLFKPAAAPAAAAKTAANTAAKPAP